MQDLREPFPVRVDSTDLNGSAVWFSIRQLHMFHTCGWKKGVWPTSPLHVHIFTVPDLLTCLNRANFLHGLAVPAGTCVWCWMQNLIPLPKSQYAPCRCSSWNWRAQLLCQKKRLPGRFRLWYRFYFFPTEPLFRLFSKRSGILDKLDFIFFNTTLLGFRLPTISLP